MQRLEVSGAVQLIYKSLGVKGLRIIQKKLAALSMLHKAKKAYYACDVIRFLVP